MLFYAILLLFLLFIFSVSSSHCYISILFIFYCLFVTKISKSGYCGLTCPKIQVGRYNLFCLFFLGWTTYLVHCMFNFWSIFAGILIMTVLPQRQSYPNGSRPFYIPVSSELPTWYVVKVKLYRKIQHLSYPVCLKINEEMRVEKADT